MANEPQQIEQMPEWRDGFTRGTRAEHETDPRVDQRNPITRLAQLACVLGYEGERRVFFMRGYTEGFRFLMQAREAELSIRQAILDEKEKALVEWKTANEKAEREYREKIAALDAKLAELLPGKD